MTRESETQQTFRIVVTSLQSRSSNEQRYIQTARQLGIHTLSTCVASRLYFLRGELTESELHRITTNLLADPVTESSTIELETFTAGQAQSSKSSFGVDGGCHVIESAFHSGVTDPPAENLRRTVRRLGIEGLVEAATGSRFELTGALSPDDLRRLATELFANPVIQHTAIDRPILPPFLPAEAVQDRVESIPLGDSDDEGLMGVSRERRLALDLAEMRAIRDYYRQAERDPTDVELEMLAQTWSEHCVHKTFRATIEYSGPDGSSETIKGLLNTTIRAATEKVSKPWVRSAFVDNAGIIAFDEQFDLAVKVETHNHPSALEPFGGANTGIGGVVRDVLGVSARPIANTDILCFGPPDLPSEELPQGVLHPVRVAEGVVRGIEDYGNKMGIPTVNGALVYHPGYTANPLVYCGCLGILPRDSHPTEPQAGDLIVGIGGRTGRDGLRGATFSSMGMDVETGEIAGTAVQIGHPIMEKQVQEVILRARDEKLYTAVTDCGAGGFSSAVGEMGRDLGARIQLQGIKLKYPGLQPWEIWLSEAQERMVLAVPPHNWARLQSICAGEDVEAIQLGRFTNDGQLHIYYGDKRIGDLDMDFLHDGLPLRRLEATWSGGREERIAAPPPQDPFTTSQKLLALLSHPDIRSKEGIIRRYDHEVQGSTAVKPLVGVDDHGPSDAAVLVPQASQKRRGRSPISAQKAVAVANGIRPNYTALDPYRMAWAAVDEAFRNVTAVGANPDQVALLDNFCWGNPNLPDRLGELVRCAQGCYDSAVAFNAPFISGKDSLNNEYTGADGRKHAIPGTLLITAVGMLPDVNRAVTMDWKGAGNFIYLVGDTRPELGGSHYQQIGGTTSAQEDVVPRPVEEGLERMRALYETIQAGLLDSCHDCSEGGIAVALAEMSLAGGLGAEIELVRVPRDRQTLAAGDEAILFSESLSRFIVEVRPENAASFEELMAGHPHGCIGVTGGEHLRIAGTKPSVPQRRLADVSVAAMASAWLGDEERGKGIKQAPEKGPAKPPMAPVSLTKKPSVLILRASGTNRDRDAALATELAGGRPEIVHVNQLLSGERRLADYGMLIIPGGFSYGDDLGAGVLWAQDLLWEFGDSLRQFVAGGRPVLGICNGFQALVKSGILTGSSGDLLSVDRDLTLTFNEKGRFECRWVWLEPEPRSPSLFTRGLSEPIYCPVAHGEGRLALRDDRTVAGLRSNHLIPLMYANSPLTIQDNHSTVAYPANPNGSILDAAALCNRQGNVLGLMPHPENHIFPWQNPGRFHGGRGAMGLSLFVNGVKHA